MKRLILILSVVVTFLGIFITAFPYLLKFSGLDASFKRWLIPKVMNGEFSQLEVDDFSVGLGSLDLNNLKISTVDKSVTLLIKNISFDFQLHELIIHPTNPKLAVNKIILDEPRLLLSSALLKKSPAVQTDSSEYQMFESFFEHLYNIRNINTIHIQDGRIIWQDSLRQFYAVAQGLQGTLQAENKHFALNVKGRLFASGEDNFELLSTFSLLGKKISGRFRLSDFNLSQTAQFLLPPQLHIFQGKVNADITFLNEALNPVSTELSGNLQVNDLHLNYKDQIIHKIGFTAKITNNKLSLSEGEGVYFDDPFTFAVTGEDLFRPVYHGEINFSTLNLSSLSGFLPFGIPDSTKMDAKVLLDADFEHKRIKGRLRSAGLRIKQTPYFNHTNIVFDWQKGNGSTFDFTSHSYGFLLSGAGKLVYGGKVLRLGLKAQKQNTEHLILNRISGKKQTLALNVNYAPAQKSLAGSWNYLMNASDDTLLAVSGSINGALDRQIVINSEQSTAPGFQIAMAFTSPLDEFAVKMIEIHDFPWAVLGSSTLFSKVLSRFNSDLKLRGSLQSLRGVVVLRDKQKMSNDLRLLTTMNHIFSEQKEVKGSLEIKNLVGFYTLSLNDRRVKGKAHFPAGVDAALNIDLLQQGKIEGGVEFSDFNLFNSLSDSAFSAQHKFRGYLNGQVKFSGNYKKPRLAANLQMDRILLNDVGYYQAYAKFESDLSNLTLDSLQLSLNNLPVLNAFARADWQSRRISGRIEGKQVDMEHILRTIAPGSSWLSGSGNYTIEVDGPFTKPRLNVRALITDGRLSKLPFDAINLTMRDSVLSGADFLNASGHFLRIQDFTIVRNGFYDFNVSGDLPLNPKDSLDMLLRFKGDALAMLPLWVPFFKRGASNSLITMEIGGNLERIKIKNALAEIDRGELWMAAVAPHVKNIHGQIKLKRGTNKVKFINLQSEVDGKTLTLNTVQQATTTDGKKLQPWYFKSLDLDFGILKMETSKRGLNLNIPGLMAQEDYGNLYLCGKKDNDAFYFAGPVKHPVVYGQVQLFDARLTYPFITAPGKTAKKSIAIEFLTNLDWDLLVRSGEDVVYYRDIPAFIDNVHTELFVDESSPGLNFKGILNKGSFKVVGKLTSSRGRLDYLDQTFRVDLFSVEFNKWDTYPVVSGRAWTTLRDSVGAPPKTIYLKLYAQDKETKAEKQQGRWEDFRFKLESADPQIGESQEQVLAYMGFSVNNIKEKATSVGGAVTERYLIHPLLRPIEKALERGLGVDLVRINSNIAKNLFFSSMGGGKTPSAFFNPFVASNNYLFLIQSSELTIGKYLTQNVYLTYTGQLVSYYNKNQPEFDVNHSFGLEYRFLRNVLLEFEFDRELMGFYRTNQQKQYLDDFKIRLRHSFTF